MATGAGGEAVTAVRRSLASVAIFAQLLLLFVPLVELRDGDATPRALATAVMTAGMAVLTAPHGHPPPHNPMTCPACIAQSLHAQLASGVRLPTVIVAQRTPVDFRTTVLPHHDPPSSHHSRAPPVVS